MPRTTLLTHDVGTEAKVREALVQCPDETVCNFMLGGTPHTATKANGRVTCAAVTVRSTHPSQLEVTDDEVHRFVQTVGRFSIPQEYDRRILPKGLTVRLALNERRAESKPPELYVLSRKNGGFFDVQACGVNYSNRNMGGAARKEPEHSGDIERAVDGERWLEHRLTGLGYKDGEVLLTGYNQKKCVDFGTAVLCIVDHETKTVHMDVFYNRAEEIGRNSTFQVVAAIIASEGGQFFTYLSIPSTEGETAFKSATTIPSLRDDMQVMRDARAAVEEAKTQYARDEAARAQRLTGQMDAESAARTAVVLPPPPRRPVAAGAVDCVYVITPGAEELGTGKTCIFVGPNGLQTQPVPSGTPQSFAGLPTYLTQALSPGYTLTSTAVYARSAMSSSERLPVSHRIVVGLTEQAIKDGQRHQLSKFHNTLFLMTSPKTEHFQGEALIKELRANIVSAMGDGSWLVVKSKNAAGKTQWLHCAGGMDGLHSLGEDVTSAVNKLLGNPKRRLPAGASVTEEVMISEPFQHELVHYAELPALLKEWLSDEDVLQDYLRKKETVQWLQRVTATLQVLSEEAVMELVAACGRVQKELVAEYGDSSTTPSSTQAFSPADIGTDAYKTYTAELTKQQSQRRGYARRLQTLLKTHLYDQMQNAGSSGTGRLGVGPKLAARADAVHTTKAVYKELCQDREKMVEYFEEREATMTLVLPTRADVWHQAKAAALEDKYVRPFVETGGNGRRYEANLGGLDTGLLTDNGLNHPNHPLARTNGEWTSAGPDGADYYGADRAYLYIPFFPSLDEDTNHFDGSAATWSLREDVSVTLQMLASLIAAPTVSTRDLASMEPDDPRVMRWVSRFLGDLMLEMTQRSTSNTPMEGEHQTMCKRLAVLQACAWGTGIEKVTSGMCFFSSSARPKSFPFVPSQWRELAQFLYGTLRLTDWTHLYARGAEWLRVLGVNRHFIQKKVAGTLRDAKDAARKAARAKQGDIKQALESAEHHRDGAACLEPLLAFGVPPTSESLERYRYLDGYDCFRKPRDRQRAEFCLLSGCGIASVKLTGMRKFLDEDEKAWTVELAVKVLCLGKTVKGLKCVWNRLSTEQRGTLWEKAPKVLYHFLGDSLLERTLSKPTPTNLLQFSKMVAAQPKISMMEKSAMRKVVTWVRETFGARKEACYHFPYFYPDWETQAAAASSPTASSPAAASTAGPDAASSEGTLAQPVVVTLSQRRAAVEETLAPMLPADDWADVREVLHAGPRTPKLMAYALGMEVTLWHAFNAFYGWTAETWADAMLAALEDPLAPDVEARIAKAMPARPLVAGQALRDAQGLLMGGER